MDDKFLNKITGLYNFPAKMAIHKMSSDKEVFKLADENGNEYFLKIYDKHGGDDMEQGVNIYHTHEQIKLEMDIMDTVTSAIHTARPVRNKKDEWISELGRSKFATITSFVYGEPMEKSDSPREEMAFNTGITVARMHFASSDGDLMELAKKRPHKRQGYIEKMRKILARGIDIGTLSQQQFEMLSQCCGVVVECMTSLDEDPLYNIGLVHTDIRWANLLYSNYKAIPIDFTRSVYSYYLYDLGEMCAHMGGPDIQSAILRGYHSVKPLKEKHFFAIQAFFVMFLMMVMAESIETLESPWRLQVLQTFEEKYHPGLTTGKGFFTWEETDFWQVIR